MTGKDRPALAVAASRAIAPADRPTPVVYLVADDALDLGWAAIPAATARGGVVLLTPAHRLPAPLATQVQRMAPDEIVLVGGIRTISDAVASAAARLTTRVVRVDRDDAAGAARDITRAAFTTAAEVRVAEGGSTTTLATASVAAAADGVPLLLTDEGSTTPTAADESVAQVLGADLVTVGADDDTRPVAARPVSEVVVIRAGRAVEAFTGAALAAASGATLVATAPHCLPAASRDAALAPTVATVTIVGGEQSIRSSVDSFQGCRSLTDPTSSWVLVNKQNPLSPMSFEPTDLTVPAMPHADGHQLRPDAAKALAAMAAASVEEGAGVIGIDTAYRSFETQEALYAKNLARRGRAWTDRWYLRAGFSEHQTGLTVDLLPIGRSNCTINDCIDETPQGVWLARNAWRHGFLLRYEKGQTPVTGVGFEPWHFRYVGKPFAAAYTEGGWRTYEQFLGQPAAPTY
ncbi:LAS superfamily LD-carboxypeptidase LdcB [Ornithinibacter aureus]|nr:LAS superfamily LD-carboxypeptidase LdcB [Ornithinibacter aureus]